MPHHYGSKGQHIGGRRKKKKKGGYGSDPEGYREPVRMGAAERERILPQKRRASELRVHYRDLGEKHGRSDSPFFNVRSGSSYLERGARAVGRAVGMLSEAPATREISRSREGRVRKRAKSASKTRTAAVTDARRAKSAVRRVAERAGFCLLYTSDAADE